MAFLGKLVLLLHGGLSIGLLAWAFGVYTHRIDFKTPEGKDPKESPGIIEKAQAQLKTQQEGSERALVRWSANEQNVVSLEGQRFPRRTFYVNRLSLVETGATADPKERRPANPVEQLTIDPRTNYLDVNSASVRPPITFRGTEPAKTIIAYQADIKKAIDDIAQAQASNKMLLETRRKLNNEITGPPADDPGEKFKGLRRLIREQQDIIENARLESLYVENFLTNQRADFGLLQKRYNAILNRKFELENATATPKDAKGGGR